MRKITISHWYQNSAYLAYTHVHYDTPLTVEKLRIFSGKMHYYGTPREVSRSKYDVLVLTDCLYILSRYSIHT